MIIYIKILVSVTLPIRRLEKLLFWNIKMWDFRRRRPFPIAKKMSYFASFRWRCQVSPKLRSDLFFDVSRR